MWCQLQGCELRFEAREISLHLPCSKKWHHILASFSNQHLPASSHAAWGRGVSQLTWSPKPCRSALPCSPAPGLRREIGTCQPSSSREGSQRGQCILRNNRTVFSNRLEQNCAITDLRTHVILSLRARVFRGSWKERNTHWILLQIIWKARLFPSSSSLHILHLLIMVFLPGSSWEAGLVARSVCTQSQGRFGLLAGFPHVLAFPAAWSWGSPGHLPVKGWCGQAGSSKCGVELALAVDGSAGCHPNRARGAGRTLRGGVLG